jgi:hypothetical protein
MSIKITLPTPVEANKQWWENLPAGSWVKARGKDGAVVVYKPFRLPENYLTFYESGSGPFLVLFPWDAYYNVEKLPRKTKIDLQINVQ